VISVPSTPNATNVVSPFSVGGKAFQLMTMPGAMSCGYGNLNGVAAATFTNVGITQTVTGSATSAPSLTGAARNYIQYQSAAATSGLVSGITPLATTNWKANYKPLLGVVFRWPGETNLRMWIGLVEVSLGATALATGPSALVNDHAALGFETGVSTKFRGSTCDGTNYSSADLTGTGAETPTANHEYLCIVDPRTEAGTACTFYLYDLTDGTSASLRKTTNVLSTSNAVGLSWMAAVTTNENVVKNMQIASYFAITN
jgi:hypothetical protein